MSERIGQIEPEMRKNLIRQIGLGLKCIWLQFYERFIEAANRS